MFVILDVSEPEVVIAGIFSTLFVYSDSKSLAAVESLLKKLLIANSSNNQVLKYFLSNLRKSTLANLKAISTSSYEPRITLLRWHCIFLESCLKSVAGEGPILSLVVSNISSLLSSFVDVSPKIRNHVFHRFVASLEVCIHSHFLSTCTSSISPFVNFLFPPFQSFLFVNGVNLFSSNQTYANFTLNKYWKKSLQLRTSY